MTGTQSNVGLQSVVISPASEPTTHDYTKPRWGHDYYVSDVHAEGQSISLSGWGKGIKEGDFLILNTDNTGRTTRYQVYVIHYYSDPPDQWRADARFASRHGNGEAI